MKKWLLSIKALAVCLAVLFSVSCGRQTSGLPSINGVKGPQFNLVGGKVLMTIKLLNLNLEAGLKAPIPKTQNSSIELAPNLEDGGMMLVFYLDVEDLKSINIGVGDGNTLPDGRPVPGIPGGRLENSLRIDTQFKGLSFFYHPKLFGVWIPFGFDTAGISGYWNMTFAEKNVGLFGLVGNDPVAGLKAGGIIFLRLQNLSDQSFKRMIEISERNPHLVY
jgi:hypothetical protein